MPCKIALHTLNKSIKSKKYMQRSLSKTKNTFTKNIFSAIDVGSNTIMMTVAIKKNNKTFNENTLNSLLNLINNNPASSAEKQTTKQNKNLLSYVKWQEGNWQYFDFIRFASLGEGMEESSLISNKAATRASNALKIYAHSLNAFSKSNDGNNSSQHSYKIPLRIAATSAMREAKNKNGVKKKLEKIINCPIEIISGTKEGRLTYLGSCANLTKNIALIDIGGGSTEVIFAIKGKYQFAISLPIGAVRWLNRYNQQTLSNTTTAKKAQAEVKKIFNTAFEKIPLSIKKKLTPCTYRAVAGVPTTLAATQHKIALNNFFLLENKKLSFAEIYSLQQQLLTTTTKNIINNSTQWQSIDKNRAPIMPISSIIFYTLLCCLQEVLGGKKEISVSIKGLRYGLIEELKKEELKTKES